MMVELRQAMCAPLTNACGGCGVGLHTVYTVFTPGKYGRMHDGWSELYSLSILYDA